VNVMFAVVQYGDAGLDVDVGPAERPVSAGVGAMAGDIYGKYF
jgi:hypothetical protein